MLLKIAPPRELSDSLKLDQIRMEKRKVEEVFSYFHIRKLH